MCGMVYRANACAAKLGETRDGDGARCGKNLILKAQDVSAKLYVQSAEFSTIFWEKPRELWLHAYYEKTAVPECERKRVPFGLRWSSYA